MTTTHMCEDTLQCFFFSATELCKDEWEHLCNSINETITLISKDYIWHRDEFKVVLPVLPDETREKPYHLLSTTCFGDNIEDEWFIIYIIMEITKIFNNLIVQAEDNDGDFLLIETADYLPAWATPEKTINRVFIHNQHLHMIPDTIVSADIVVELVDAINLVILKHDETKASPEIEQAIAKRISNQQKFKQNYHKVILKLPLDIAAVLTLKPSLISPIVETYSSFDVIDAKNCRDIAFNDCIDAEITFTKYLYAKLMQTKLPNYLKYNISNKEKKIQLGLKVTCGYKIIMSKLCKDISCTPEYEKFFNNLIKNGYFNDNLEGSVEYTKLLEKAKTYFFDMECSVSSNASNVINDLKFSDEFTTVREVLKQNDTNLLQEDDDNWLNVSSDELNDFLHSNYGKKIKIGNDPITPHILSSELTNFLKETSDFEGIEQNIKENTDEIIDFNSDEFVNSLEKILNLVSSLNEPDSDSDSSCGDENNSDATNNIDEVHDVELKSNLKSFEGYGNEANILNNFTQSVKEEGSYGPASTILRQIGLNKSTLLDSDDEE